MPACPVCRDDFEDDVEVCPVDGAGLVARDALPAPVDPEASLGVFHPSVAEVVTSLAASRGAAVRTVEIDAVRVEVRVPSRVRDRLRADLTVGWGSVIAALPDDAHDAARTVGDRLPGWHDAPAGAWVDDHGRLRVEASPDEEEVLDASRRIGPGLAIAGAVGLLLAWVTDGGDVLWLTAGAALVLGLLLPL